MREPILITGIARSGTSLVANIIDQAGANGGEMNLNPIPVEQPTGFYENTEFDTKISKWILAEHGYDQRGQKAMPGKDFLPFDVRELAFDIMRGQGVGEDEVWFVKNCKAILIFHTYLESFPGSKWVLVRRNMDDIVDSCIRASFMGSRHTLGEWNEWYIHWKGLLDELKRQAGDSLREVWYEKLMEGDYREVENVLTWLGLRYDEKYIDNIIIRKDGKY